MVLKELYYYVLTMVTWFIGFFLKVKNNKILVSNFNGKGYGCNPKYIVNELLKSKKNLRIVWLLENIEDGKYFPKEIECCSNKGFKAIYHIVTSKVLINNCRSNFWYKKKTQFYVQTWHGFALKKIEKDAVESLDESYIMKAKKDSLNIDLIISCSNFMTNIYKKAFWYDGEIFEIGAPRNDILIKNDTNILKDVRKRLHLEDDRSIILYAPTFRRNMNFDQYKIDFKLLTEVCKLKFNKEFVVLIRFHPNMSNLIRNFDFNKYNCIDVTGYPDIQELLCAADILVTDYSSVMFDFALSSKPCFIFATDIESFKSDRNFYFDINNLPFSISENNDSLSENILNFDSVVYCEKIITFFKNIGMVDNGDATQKCVDIILKKIDIDDNDA